MTKAIEILDKYLDDDTELILKKAPVYNERYIIKLCKIHEKKPVYAAKLFYKEDIFYIDIILDELKRLLESEILRRTL